MICVLSELEDCILLGYELCDRVTVFQHCEGNIFLQNIRNCYPSNQLHIQEHLNQ